jgi:hypothetical protein
VEQSVSQTRFGDQAFLLAQSVVFSGTPGSDWTYRLVTVDGSDVFIVMSAVSPRFTHPTLAAVADKLIARVSALR